MRLPQRVPRKRVFSSEQNLSQLIAVASHAVSQRGQVSHAISQRGQVSHAISQRGQVKRAALLPHLVAGTHT